jgi:hypothetical protein
MTGFSLDELRVVANVPQRLIVPVRQYKQARVLPPNGRQRHRRRKIDLFPLCRSAEQRVQGTGLPAQKRPKDLYPGMFVKTAFRVGEASGLTVPRQRWCNAARSAVFT